jgi:pimeloyl-ACP methyl ester carboxylesterase
MVAARANGILIDYDVFGPPDGVPLLLIHGFAQQSIGWPPELIDGFVRAGLRVIVFDNRDTGFSQKWDGQIPDFAAIMSALRERRKPEIAYALADMAADAAGLLDALNIASAHVLGASMGGMIAQILALQHRPKLRSLTLVFTSPGDLDLPQATPEARRALTERPPAHDRDSVIANVLASRKIYGSKGFEQNEARIAGHAGRAFDRMFYPEGGARHWAAILATPPRGRHLKRLDLPSLVLHGSDDTLIPPENGRRLAERIPGAEYHEIAGWGHDFPLTVIPLLLDRIVPFIAKAQEAQKH